MDIYRKTDSEYNPWSFLIMLLLYCSRSRFSIFPKESTAGMFGDLRTRAPMLGPLHSILILPTGFFQWNKVISRSTSSIPS